MEKKTTIGRSKATTKETRPKAKPGDKRIGNEFWKLCSKHGRDKLFSTPDLLWEAACEYFEHIHNNPLKEQKLFSSQGAILEGTENKLKPFTIQGLCIYLGVNTKYLYDFEDSLKGKSDDLSKGFSEIITRIREIIYVQKFEGAAAGFFNPNIIARDLGLVDKKEVEVETKMSPEERTERIAVLMAKINELNG
ncbi:terminase small subunit [Elizabethkingia meningoseptica]|uniref:terminase small subunit n=1 Tax=Elizabethkingia meningoseptica TaxID=238 RepID=UPI003891FED9